jgi:hypothetical protein
MICARLMFVRAGLTTSPGIRNEYGAWVADSTRPAVPMHLDPVKAPGIDCIGSLCSQWIPEIAGSPAADNGRGRCADNPTAPSRTNPAKEPA